MGKKQHQKDKLWLTTTEWSTLYGGKKAAKKDKKRFRRLPFNCCSISFLPFDVPYCTREGVCFDLINIAPFIKKHGINPVTGKKLGAKDLIKLHFHKNKDDKYHCPVTYKIFNESTHIVAIATTGNVFSYEAVERLNLKPKLMEDLLSGKPFKKEDIVPIQDPNNLDKFNISAFYHVLHKVEEAEANNKASGSRIRTPNLETRETLAQLKKDYKASGDGFDSHREETTKGEKRARDHLNAAHYSTGAAAASLTSTVMLPTTKLEAAVLDEDAVRYPRVKKKGYIRLVTTHGNLNLELFCDQVPKTCENFLILCRRRYYDDTLFHRSIRHFMVQGGDPLGNGTGGESAWGAPFKDEFRSNLSHEGRGNLSMANSGKDTNRSQFFITFRSCKHLNNKHTLFGKVVGGLETLDNIEAVETDSKDRPIEDIRLMSTVIFVDPFEEVDEELRAEREAKQEEEEKEREKAEAGEKKMLKVNEAPEKPVAFRQGVGKFLNLKRIKEMASKETEAGVVIKKPKVEGNGSFKDFSMF